MIPSSSRTLVDILITPYLAASISKEATYSFIPNRLDLILHVIWIRCLITGMRTADLGYHHLLSSPAGT